MPPAPPLPVVFSVDMLVRRGMTPAQVRTRVTRGEYRRLRRGAYCRAVEWQQASPERRHALEAAGYALTHGSSYVFSHATAAALLGLPLPQRDPNTLHLTVDPAFGLTPRRDGGVARHVARLPAGDVVAFKGLRLTSATRTVADCLRRLTTADAVAVADAALHAGRCNRQQVRHLLGRQRDWPYARVALLALELVDARRESPLESRSAVVMHQYGIPAPRPQVEIQDADGRPVARVDFAWLEHGVVGEADGRTKYGGDAGRVVEAEKDRQAKLEGLGLRLVRWGDRHLHGGPPPMVVRLRTALAVGDASRFTGRVA